MTPLVLPTVPPFDTISVPVPLLPTVRVLLLVQVSARASHCGITGGAGGPADEPNGNVLICRRPTLISVPWPKLPTVSGPLFVQVEFASCRGITVELRRPCRGAPMLLLTAPPFDTVSVPVPVLPTKREPLMFQGLLWETGTVTLGASVDGDVLCPDRRAN